MRRYTTLISMICSMLFTPAAFAGVNIFACEPEWAALAKEIGGEQVSVYTATTALQDPHHIEARPSLIAQLRQADIAVCTGAELEIGWLPMLQRQAGNNKVQAGAPGDFAAAMQVERLEIPARVDRAMGDVHAAGNPHVHLDPRRVLVIAEALTQRLQTIDAANAAVYANGFAAFKARWLAALHAWEQRAAPLRGVRVITHHRDWVYLFDWLGIDAVASLEAKPGLPPSAAHLAALRQQLQQQPVRMVIRAAYQDARPSEWLAQQAGIKAVLLPYTVGGSARAQDLFGLYDDSIDRLLSALQ